MRLESLRMTWVCAGRMAKMAKVAAMVTVVAMVPVAGAAPAEAGRGLEACYEAALKRSETVAIQAELIDQAQETVRQAFGSILPGLNANANYTWQETPETTLSNSISPSFQRNIRLTATQPLFRGFREFAALRGAKENVVAQEHAYRNAASQLYLEVSQGFYSITSLERDLRNIEKQIELYGKRITELNARIKIGRSRGSEVLAIESARASLRAQAELTMGQIRAARIAFGLLTGLDQNIPLKEEVVSHAKTVRLDSMDRYLAGLEFRPDVQAEKARIAAVEQNIRVAEGAHWPTLDLLGNYYLSRTGVTKDINWDVQLAFSLPLFAGGTIQSRVRQAESQLRQEDQIMIRIKRLAQQDIQTSYEAVTADQAMLKALEDARKAAEQSYLAQAQDYRWGLVTNLDVLQALASFQDAQRAWDRARFTTELDFSKLEVAAAIRPARQ